MSFSSLVFLFRFLPIFLLIYFLLKPSARAFFMVLASLLFYFWGEGEFTLLLILAVLGNYLFGLLIGARRNSLAGRWAAVAAVCFNLSLLGIFKYTNFFIDAINPILRHLELEPMGTATIHLPIGISFFTFQALSYIIDVKRDQAPAERSLLSFSVYMTMFPKLITGPITPYRRLRSQLRGSVIVHDDIRVGVRRFILGLAKKALLADQLAPVVHQVFSVPGEQLTAGVAWLGVIAFTLQIYFDFSGYTDMAIGLGRICGFSLVENFNYPYLARSIRDFWARWHISLANWLRDYLFLPIAYSTMRRIRGDRVLRIKAEHWGYAAAAFFTMLLCGLWHGANWTFVLWGGFFGVMLVIEHAGLEKFLKRRPRIIRIVYAQLLVVTAWAVFRADNLAHAMDYLRAMWGLGSGDGRLYHTALFVNQQVLVVFAAAIIAATPAGAHLMRKLQARLHRKNDSSSLLILSALQDTGLLLLFWFSVIAIAGGTYHPFIYFRF